MPIRKLPKKMSSSVTGYIFFVALLLEKVGERCPGVSNRVPGIDNVAEIWGQGSPVCHTGSFWVWVWLGEVV